MATRDKEIQLNALGTRVEGILAYDDRSLVVDMVENTRALGRFTISPSSLVFGQTATISVGPSDQLSSLYLTMRIVVPVGTPNICAGSAWGYMALNSFNYQLGPTSMGSHNVSGYGALLANLASAESGVKRQAILDLGGTPFSGPGTYDATIILPIVMSNTYHGEHKLPLDLVGLNSPLVVNLVFSRGTDFLSGSNAINLLGFDRSWITAETFYLTDRGKSPALISRMKPGWMVCYPYYHVQSGTLPSFVANAPGQETPLALTNLINADPMAVVFAVYRQSSLVQNSSNSSPLCCSNMYTPDDVKLLINGEVWNWTPSSVTATLDEFVSAGSDLRLTSGYMAPGGQLVHPFVQEWKRSGFYIIQLSQQRTVAQTGLLANTRRTPQATPQLMLTFNSAPGEGLVLHYIYIYQAMVKMEGGSTYIYLA